MRPNPIPVIAAMLLISLSLAAQDDSRYKLLLKSGPFIPQKNITTDKLNQFDRTANRAAGKMFAILQFENIPTAAERKQLHEGGIELLEYIPNNAYTVTITGSLNADILTQLKARAVIELTPEQKMQSQLAKGNFPAWAVKTPGTIDVWISFPQSFIYETVSEELKSRNFDIISSENKNYRIIGLRVASSRLTELASLSFIEYVQPVPHSDQSLNSNSMALSRANILRAPISAGGRGLDGSGVVIGVGDDGDVQSHIDFSERLINRAAFTSSGHGVHVTGTAAGAGIIRENYMGYAPKATIVSQSFSNIFTFAPVYVQDYGMVVTNNSYGSVVNDCSYNGFYDLSSRILDQQAFDLPELQQVFAAGNDGTSTCSPYPFGFRTVLGGYQSAKNVITVGNADYKGDSSIFSSKGPVKDGRIKPEIMSQGTSVRSLWLNNTFSSFSGTSMATPGISGGLVLLIQRYRQLHSGANPKNALLKALICNGASDKGRDGPDFTNGFGTMDLLRSVTMMENSTYFNSTVANSLFNTHTVSVPANTARLKVTLYWVDPPASLLSAKTLVNDLDLQITTPAPTTVLLPRVLDTIPSNVTAVAGSGADHINNIEQIIIDNPATGNYSLKVTGTSITQNPTQEYFLVYDVIPQGLVLTNPVGGELFVPTTTAVAIDSIHIQWDSYGGTPGQFTLELSTDNGSSWSLVSPASNIISSSSRLFNWGVPDVQTEQARIRITNNNTAETKTSFPFIIIGQPIDSLTPDQCEGYIKLGWRNTPGATDYEVMMLQGDGMVSVATTTALNYTFSGLSKDSVYWVAVRPRINGVPGRRAIAVSRQPNSGTCTGNISDNDLKIDSVLSPVSGREFTSTALTNSVPVTIRIKNLDDQVSTDDIIVTYSINGGAAVTETINGSSTPSSTIAAGGFIDYTFSTNANLAATGTYSFAFTVTKATDLVVANNSLIKVVKQLNNQPITSSDLPWLDNFETATSQTIMKKQMGLDGRDRYDFVNSTVNGRLRTFINSGIASSGSKAVTLDADRFVTGGNTDSLTGTFNLATLNASLKDIRLDFLYKNHGQVTNAANKVWIRSNDGGSWIEVYDLFANQDATGSFKRSSSIELSNVLLTNSTNFSTSFQVRWGQNGRTQTTDNDGSAGYTFDDIRLYEVQNDMQMISVDEPAGYGCALTATTPVKITIRNSNSSALTNIPVKYRINGGAFITAETISSIAANTTVQYTFATTADLSVLGSYTIQSVVSYPGDSYAENDTAIASVVNLPVVSSFPYLQNFELNNGSWFTLGSRNSWEYGTPASIKINRAASGSKAWKTNLAGYHNDAELSYLYSPCFDISAMTNPTLSFSLALDIEDCGSTLCDAAWVEYSADGITWTKLGAMGQGTNWYNKNYAGNQLWSQQNYTRWHVASTALPTSSNARLRLRFVFNSDAGLSKDGIAVDDIHIYDNTFGIYDVTGASPVSSQLTVSGSGWVNFIDAGTNKLIASVNPNGQTLGNTYVQSFVNTGGVRIKNSQYYHDRNITIKPTTVNLLDSATVRFYFLDSESEALINATGCGTCYKPSTAYDLGVSKYSHPDDNIENGTIADNNSGGNWLFINSPKATKVPFDKGYYAEFKVKDFSEFWLNNGGFDNLQSLPVQLISFTARKTTNAKDVLVEWKTASEINVNHFEIEVAKGNVSYQQNQFVKIGELNSAGNSTLEQQYTFTDIESNKSGVRYYRLKTIDNDGSFKYSAIRSVVFDNEIKWQINPNPSSGKFNLTYQSNDGDAITIKVYDVNGKTIKLYRSVANGFVQKVNIDLEEPKFATGLYLLEVSAGGKSQSFKLIKQ